MAVSKQKPSLLCCRKIPSIAMSSSCNQGRRLGTSTARDRQNMISAREALQRKYDIDKEIYAEKMREKERQKLIQKLSRYQGVGELGIKLQNVNLSNGEKDQDLMLKRISQQEKLQNDTNLYLERKNSEMIAAQNRLSSASGPDVGTDDACKLGGNITYERGKGEHPLLARLATKSTNNQ